GPATPRSRRTRPAVAGLVHALQHAAPDRSSRPGGPSNMRPARTFLLLLTLATAACDADSGAASAVPPEELTYAPELDIRLEELERSPSGLYSQDLVAGDGETARPGARVTVHYTGWFADGSVFDTSREEGNPVEFLLMDGQVI